MSGAYAIPRWPITLAPEGFRWQGEGAVGLPVVLERDGTVCEPLLRFFGWSHRYKRTKISSMKDEAYILRDWWAYLAEIGQPWDNVNDQVMIDWRETQRSLDGIDQPRISRKLEVVFRFYELVPRAMLLKQEFVSPEGPITTREHVGGGLAASSFRMSSSRRRASGRLSWACGEAPRHKMIKRKTPNDQDVLAVLTHLRGAKGVPSIGERDWLMGRVMAEAGLRRDEVARLTVGMLEAGLRKEGVRVVAPKDRDAARKSGWNSRLPGLSALAGWAEGWDTILSGLNHLERSHRTNIYVEILGKGDVVRQAPFPIDLVRDLLAIGIWGIRHSQITRWADGRAAFVPPPELFLSEKTGGPLSAGSIGDVVKDAFNACGIDGSGHRLRAYFATKLASRLWAEYFAGNGFRWDQRIENMVLDKVAEALGHRHVTITVRHYLDLALLTYFGEGTKARLKDLRRAWAAITKHHQRLSREQIDLIARVAERLGSDAQLFHELLVAALDDPELAPTGGAAIQASQLAMERSERRPLLRVVPRNPAS